MPAVNKELRRVWLLNNNDRINTLRRNNRAKRLLDPKERKKERIKRAEYFRKHDKPYHAARTKRYRNKLKTGVITAYGGACTCCGETTHEFLTLDHVNNNGKAERMALFGKNAGATMSIYRTVRDAGYPPDYTVLCFNCNIARSLFGTCPHQR